MKQNFETEIDRAQATENPAREAEMRSRYGLWLGQQQEWRSAAAQFEQAAQLALAARQTGLAAQYRYAQALTLQHLPTQQPAAREQLAEALRLYREVDEPAALARAQRNLALQRVDEGDFPGALAALDEGITALDGADVETTTAVSHLRAELHRDRAILHWMNGTGKVAEEDLTTAVSHARRATDPALVATIKEVRRALKGETAVVDPLAQQLQQALAAGSVDTSSHPLQAALTTLQQGDVAKALTQAELVRRAALDSSSFTRYPRYLSACLLIALARERLGDDAGVIAILLTAKGTLERHLGKRVGQQLGYLLDALYPRWGEARFQAALAAYRESNK